MPGLLQTGEYAESIRNSRNRNSPRRIALACLDVRMRRWAHVLLVVPPGFDIGGLRLPARHFLWVVGTCASKGFVVQLWLSVSPPSERVPVRFAP